MLRSTPPRSQARGGGRWGASLFPSRSQPDLTLVGVKSVLSPRPFSAPHAVAPGMGGARHPFHASCCSSHSDVTSRASSQEGASEDTLSEAQESEYTGQYEDENEDLRQDSHPSDVQSGGSSHAIPAALLGLHAQTSRDSALGSSIDGAARHPPDDPTERDLTLDTPRTAGDAEEGDQKEGNIVEDYEEEEDFEEGRAADTKEGTQKEDTGGGRLDEEDIEEGEKDILVSPQPKEPDKQLQQGRQRELEQYLEQCPDKNTEADEGTEKDTDSTNAQKSPSRPTTLNIPKTSKEKRRQPGKPYSRVRLPRDSYSPLTTSITNTLTSSTSRPYPVTPLTPPPLKVTPDPGPAATDHKDASDVNVQEVIDVRLMEAHRSGHLNLSNLGLPFFPSAVLLVDASIIHRLSMQDNRLVELPPASLSLLTHLTWLDLRYNLLTYLPQEISALVSLQVLLLQGNRLTALPTSLGTLPALVTLQVSDNPLTFPPNEVIRGGARAIILFLREASTATSTNSTSACSSSGSGVCTSTPVKIPVSMWENSGGEVRHEHLIYDENVISSVEDDGDDGEEEENSEDEGDGSAREDGKGRGCCSTTLVAAVDKNEVMQGNRGIGIGYLECPPSPMPSLRVAIRTSREETSPHHYPQEGVRLTLHPQPPDSDGDTLVPPASPVSPCLLTPNTDLPTRTTFDLTRDDLEEYERELVMTLELEGFAGGIRGDLDAEELLALTREGIEVLERMPDGEMKQRLLRCLAQRHTLTEHCVGSLPEFDGHLVGHHRRALHLHLQADQQQQYFEDDSESLQGDLGEGYRRPHSQNADEVIECPKKVSPLPLPVVSLELPSTGEAWDCNEKSEDAARAGGRGGRRHHLPRKTVRRGGSKCLHKPKLATVAEVHRRAREERRRQREILAAAREMTGMQRLKSMEGLEAWREEVRLLQEQRALSPEGYLPAVCEAPFAVDGTILTPRARSRLRSSGAVRSSLSPSVSEVCAGVRSCLEELNTTKTCSGRRRGGGGGGGGGKDEEAEDNEDNETRKGGERGAGGGAGGGGGGVGGKEAEGRVVGSGLAHSAALVHQLHHLRRQLHRLKVNCVI